MTEAMQTGQERLEAYIEKTLYENNVVLADKINGKMKMEAAGGSFEDRTLSFAFPVQEWQANRANMLHGGILCTAIDATVSALARFVTGANYAPTISLDVKFVRPAMVGDTIVVTAKATATGKRITQLTAEVKDKETGKLIATAASVYMNVDTSR